MPASNTIDNLLIKSTFKDAILLLAFGVRFNYGLDSYISYKSRPERVIHSVLSARLIRNVRKAAAASTDYSTSSAMATSRLGGLEFAVNTQAAPAPDSTFVLPEVQDHV